MSSASIAQPAQARHSAPRAQRHTCQASTTANTARKACRHHAGVPDSPSSRAVSAGMLCVATSCCWSPSALRKPKAPEPKPASAITARTASHSRMLPSVRRRASRPGRESARKGSVTAAETFTPTPATSAAAAPPAPAATGPAARAMAAASASISSVSLCAPPTASTSSTGFRPTKATGQRSGLPSRAAARPTSATAPRLAPAASALKAHIAPATPSGAVA